jgi:hypothetical protein
MAARAARDINAQPDAILIVVDEQFPYGLYEPTGRTLVPQNLSTAAVIMSLTRTDGELQCLGVHVALHE